MAVSKEELVEWLQHPVTKAFKEHLTSIREDLKELWARGSLSEDTEFKTAVKQAWAIGQCDLLERLLDVEALESAINQEQAENA